MREEYRDIKGWEGLYQVSNKGNVKSLERTVRSGKGYRVTKEIILKPKKTISGYLYVGLWKESKVKRHYIHRLVAEAFLENTENLSEINHIDENKENNCVENLEWCSSKYNCNHGTRNRRIAEANTNHPKMSKPVIAISKESGLILEYPSTHEASRQLGIAQQSIVECCKGRLKTSGSFYWMYKD